MVQHRSDRNSIPVDTLIQVTDTDGQVHAAAIGPGVLCQTVESDKAAPAVQTVVWDYGTDLVDCRACLGRLRELQLVRPQRDA